MRKRYNNGKYILLVAFLMFTQCKSQQKEDSIKEENKMEAEMTTKMDIEMIISMPKNEAVQTFGNPNEQDSFVLDESLPEFRIELYNYFTEEAYLSSSIQIKEFTWYYGEMNKERITIWYQEKNNLWQPIHHLFWNEGDEF